MKIKARLMFCSVTEMGSIVRIAPLCLKYHRNGIQRIPLSSARQIAIAVKDSLDILERVLSVIDKRSLVVRVYISQTYASFRTCGHDGKYIQEDGQLWAVPK